MNVWIWAAAAVGFWLLAPLFALALCAAAGRSRPRPIPLLHRVPLRPHTFAEPPRPVSLDRPVRS